MPPGGYGLGPFGDSPYGGGTGLLEIVATEAINPFNVVVEFSEALDNGPATFDPSNYQIPGLTVIKVISDEDPSKVRLVTSIQDYLVYELSVTNLVSESSAALDPLSASITFTGWPHQPRFTARAVSSRAIQVLFAQPMAPTPDLFLQESYNLADWGGNPIGVVAVIPATLTDVVRVRLELASPMVSGETYVLNVSKLLETPDGRTLLPNDTTVLWQQPAYRTSIPFRSFTGEVKAPVIKNRTPSEVLFLTETLSISVDALTPTPPVPADLLEEALTLTEVAAISHFINSSSLTEHDVVVSEPPFIVVEQGQASREKLQFVAVEALSIREALSILPEIPNGLGRSTAALFGNPNGQVFFSPSLVVGGAPNSSLQIDNVSVCTKAYDTYTFPQPVDPLPLYTHGGGVVPSLAGSVLGAGVVLFTNFYRLGEAKLNFSLKPSDTAPPPADIAASIQLIQVWDPLRFALLNNSAWGLGPIVPVPPPAPPPPSPDLTPPLGDPGAILDTFMLGTGSPPLLAAPTPPLGAPEEILGTFTLGTGDEVGVVPLYSFICADNLNPVGAPTVLMDVEFLNPQEVLTLVEGHQPHTALHVGVQESLGLIENFHLTPGQNQYVVPLAESLTLSEGFSHLP